MIFCLLLDFLAIFNRPIRTKRNQIVLAERTDSDAFNAIISGWRESDRKLFKGLM